MTPERYARVKELFGRALDLPASQRDEFLTAECDDDELRDEVENLLSLAEDTGGFLATPPASTAIVGEAAGLEPVDETIAAAGSRFCFVCRRRFDASVFVCPDDGEPLLEDNDALVGATLDNTYRVEAVIGQGGMGTVYRASHLLLRDTVAIKVLPRELSEDSSRYKRFLREGQAARRFRHPNAVSVFDLRSVPDGPTFLVQEFVDGETLRSLLRRRKRLEWEEVFAVLEPLAGALDAAHASGVVHRDVKPANIMITSDERRDVKLLDLGIAKLREIVSAIGSMSELTQESLYVGTPLYMSPEQWGDLSRDGVVEIDGRADVYSLAIVAYEMITGERPFAGDAALRIRLKHLAPERPSASEVRPDLSPAVDAVLVRGMACDRSDRPATAGDFVRELRAAAVGAETAPGEAAHDASAPRRRFPATPLVLGLGAIAAAAAITFAMWPPRAAEPPSSAPATVVAAPAPAESREPIRYALELEKRTAEPGANLVRPDEAFKIRFRFPESGRLYILAPGDHDALKAFLTDRPLAESGVRSNEVIAGRDFVFPDGPRHWLGVVDTGAPTVYTIVFAPTTPPELPFAALPAGRTLSPDERAALDMYTREHASLGAPGEVGAVRSGAAPGRPVAFSLTIRHH